MTPSAYWLNVNSAVTDVSAAIVTVQGPVLLQPAPLQPANVEPVLGVAVNVTVAPWGYVSEQSAPQSDARWRRRDRPGARAGLAHRQREGVPRERRRHAVAAVTVTVQSPVPGQPTPLQPKKAEPADGVAVERDHRAVIHRLGAVGAAVDARWRRRHGPGAGAVLGDREPYCLSRKSAVTITASSTSTVHAPVPVQPPPLQPSNVESAAAVAASVTVVPGR